MHIFVICFIKCSVTSASFTGHGFQWPMLYRANCSTVDEEQNERGQKKNTKNVGSFLLDILGALVSKLRLMVVTCVCPFPASSGLNLALLREALGRNSDGSPCKAAEVAMESMVRKMKITK